MFLVMEAGLRVRAFFFPFIFLLKLFSLFTVIAFIMKNIMCDFKRNDLATWWQYAVKNI